MADAGLLTADELRALDLTGELAVVLARIPVYGPTRDGDLRELVAHVHGLQHTIMAQAAARAYPKRFRLLGGVVGE
jgi:hypothetical protein